MAVPQALLPLLLVASLAAAAEASTGSDMSAVNVLLHSGMTNPVQYRLLATHGCYVRSWDDHDIFWIHPEFNHSAGCSTSASLVSTSPLSDRNEVTVYARNLQLGTTESIIVAIPKIKIFDHANKIDLGDLPKQIQLEDTGASSDSYVINGIGTGHEDVGAQVHEQHLQSLVKSPMSHKDEVTSHPAAGRTAETDMSYKLLIVVFPVSLLGILFIMYQRGRLERHGSVTPLQTPPSEVPTPPSFQPSEVPTPPSFQPSRRTPLPYMEYLKSTIHETPHYYSGRRFNPNSY